MSPLNKRLILLAVILGGYVGAFLVAELAVYLNNLHRDPAVSNTGMAAGGDMILFLGVFGVVSVIPTAVLLYSLRRFHTLWLIFATVSLLLACTGPFLVLAMIVASHPGVDPFWTSLAQAGVLRTFAAPVFALAFLVCAIIASAKPSRWLFVSSAGLEICVCIYGLVHWFLPLWFHSTQ